MALDDMNQILLMNSKIISIKADLIRAQLKIESYKHNDETKRKRKRSIGFEDEGIPTEYDLSMVDKKDKKHIQGILRNLLGMTTMEFTSEIKTSAGYYDLQLKDIECLNVEYIAEVVQKYRAFITETVFDYPQHQMTIQVRRNDTPITSIRKNVTFRKKLKIR
jgi:RNA binding exosome subunit